MPQTCNLHLLSLGHTVLVQKHDAFQDFPPTNQAQINSHWIRYKSYLFIPLLPGVSRLPVPQVDDNDVSLLGPCCNSVQSRGLDLKVAQC